MLVSKRLIVLTEAIKHAVHHKLRRKDEEVALQARIAALRAEVTKRPPIGQDADKAFYDELSGGL